MAQVIFKDWYTPLEFHLTRNGRSLHGIDAVRELRLPCPALTMNVLTLTQLTEDKYPDQM